MYYICTFLTTYCCEKRANVAFCVVVLVHTLSVILWVCEPDADHKLHVHTCRQVHVHVPVHSLTPIHNTNTHTHARTYACMQAHTQHSQGSAQGCSSGGHTSKKKKKGNPVDLNLGPRACKTTNLTIGPLKIIT